jgi:hypothetical protein
MSSLWTPGGEHPVGDGGETEEQRQAPSGAAPTGPADDADPLAGLSPEEREQAEEMAAQMADVQRQLLEAPPETVVANHAMGLYELAAIHLSAEQPSLEAARLAIDAMTALVEQLEGRLGEAEATLRDALGQLQMAFVQIQDRLSGADGEA